MQAHGKGRGGNKMFDEPNILETVLFGIMLATGIVAIAYYPVYIPLGVLAIVAGAGGLVFGHW